MLSRRALIKAGGLTLFAAGVSGPGPLFLGRTALAAPGSTTSMRRKVLVTIFQRGAMDGLMAVSPLDERRLQRLRPRLAMSASRRAGDSALIDLGVDFGMHPGLGALEPLWKENRLAIVHAVGSPDPTRSHFDAQDYMETGTPGRKGTPSGWLNRVSGLLGHEATPFRSVAMTAALPRSFYGDEAAIAVTDLADFQVKLPGARRVSTEAGQGFEALYAQASQELLRDTGAETFEAVEMLEKLEPSRYRPSGGARYPNSPLGQSLRQVAMLIKADVGLEVAFAETGGWDTHVQQGTANGSFAQRSRDLAGSIEAFWTDLGSHQDNVVLMTMTEFGRTVRENGSGGTDHGHGSCMFVLGNEVQGGRVHGDFPGIEAGALYEGRDLPVTTDFRALFSEVAGRHLGIDDDEQMFPGWNGGRSSVMKT